MFFPVSLQSTGYSSLSWLFYASPTCLPLSSLLPGRSSEGMGVWEACFSLPNQANGPLASKAGQSQPLGEEAESRPRYPWLSGACLDSSGAHIRLSPSDLTPITSHPKPRANSAVGRFPWLHAALHGQSPDHEVLWAYTSRSSLCYSF